MFEETHEVVYVGLDWAALVHAVCVMSATGKVLAQFTIEHTGDGIAALILRLAKYGDTEPVGDADAHRRSWHDCVPYDPSLHGGTLKLPNAA